MDVYMFGLFNKGSLLPLVGIDFGSQTIKAVTLSGRPGKLHLESVADIPTPKGTLVDYQLPKSTVKPRHSWRGYKV